jgi:hypothetical protein
MKRINYILLRNKPYQIDFAEDVRELIMGIPILAGLEYGMVDRLYSDWSEDFYCASWLCLSDSGIKEFENWLNEEMDEV